MRRAPAAVAVLVGAAAVLSACGQDGGGPGVTSGAAAVAPAGAVDPAVRAEQLAIHRQVTAALTRSRASTATYGTPPAYLPVAKVPVHRVVTASAAHPVLAVEGDTVALAVPGARGRATLVGPILPAGAQGADVVPARFDLTIVPGHGPLHLTARDVTITDEHGRVHRPALTFRGGRPLTGAALPAGPAHLVLRARLPTGNGQVRLQPGTASPVASWDFVVETD